jgi:hypothetical protein
MQPNTCNLNWANEVGNAWFAEAADLDNDGWKDPWGRYLNKRNLSKPKPSLIQGYTVQQCNRSCFKGDVVLAVYTRIN